MKKIIALLLSICLITSLATSTVEAAKKKKVAKKKVVKKKVVKRPPVKKAAPSLPEAPWTPPAPESISPVPAPTPAAAPSAPAAGMGMSIGGKVGMVAGTTGIIGNLDYSIASIVPGAKVRVTADYLSGTNAGGTYKIVDLGIGAIYALDMLKSASLPIDWYAGGSVFVPVKVSSGSSGSFGLAAIVGGTYLIPDFGTLSGELGYGAIKGLNAKGVVASIGYSYAF